MASWNLHEPDGDRRWAPLLPADMAERLRPIAYAVGAALGAAGAAYALPLEASPLGCALGAGALALLWSAARWLDRAEDSAIAESAPSASRSRSSKTPPLERVSPSASLERATWTNFDAEPAGSPLRSAPTRYPPYCPAEALRLAGAAYTGATMPLPLEVVRDE